MTGLWHFIVHLMGVDFGAPYGRWVWYNFWSGIAGSFLVGLSVWLIGRYTAHTCHVWWCPRRGLFDYDDPVTGLRYKLCRHCHPVHSGKRLTRRNIADMEENGS
jgi:hypothetical protein